MKKIYSTRLFQINTSAWKRVYLKSAFIWDPALKLENMVRLVTIKTKKLLLYIAYDFALICVTLDKSEVNQFCVACTNYLLWPWFSKRSVQELDVLFSFILHIIVPGKPKVSIEQPEDAVIVSWILEEKNGVIKDYHVIYSREDDSSDSKSKSTQETELHFDNLIAGKTYEFQVGTI